jgi:hypothetical protein
MLEDQELDQETTATTSRDQGQHKKATSSTAEQPAPLRRQSSPTTTQQRQAWSAQWAQQQRSEEISRWAALLGGGWLALFALRRSLGSLTLLGLGGGLLYYTLTKQWPATQARKPSHTP